MKILLTGVQGQLGFELRTALAPLGEVIAVDRTLLDLSQPESVGAQVRALRPDLIVNPAAYTAVDRAESEADLCHAVNHHAVAALAQAAEALGAAVIHYSTDYVFDGTLDRPYVETDATRPLNVYGASKRAGELALAAACSQHLTLRTSWVYGQRGSNFLRTMLRLSLERTHLRVVADQTGAPTWCRQLAEDTATLVARQVVRQDGRTRLACPAGIVHLTGAGSTSWAGFAREIFRLSGRTTEVEDIPASAYPTPAARPLNSRLQLDLAERLLGRPVQPWQTALSRCLQDPAVA